MQRSSRAHYALAVVACNRQERIARVCLGQEQASGGEASPSRRSRARSHGSFIERMEERWRRRREDGM